MISRTRDRYTRRQSVLVFAQVRARPGKGESFSSLATKVCHARKKPPPLRSNKSAAESSTGIGGLV
ncbi:hypothetical protein WN48_09601 [Eufriesea mexicana]|uniref:Uncharacterized protein n=1 Tax=Eufriesea mexicana TaxID=516756 RepID=A0A310SJ71_9HYME|nr:hypothetical protein WN48_09601 [Eufriesea mexicana]